MASPESDELGNIFSRRGPAISAVASNVGTIATTGTLQATSLVVNAGRVDATVINLGTHAMQVAFGTSLGAPALATTVPLSASGTLTLSGIVGSYTGAVAIAGTSGDTFLVIELT